MAQRRENARTARPPLTRERVLRAAVEVADRQGLDALSMRKLAQGFGVVPMALYKHVSNKDDLIDGMVDLVFDEIELPSGGADWKSAMRRRALSARQVLSRHRWAIGLTESRMKPGPTNLRHHDSVIRCLAEGGFSIEMTIHAYSAIDSYIYGFALQERQLPFENPDEVGEVAETMLSQFPAGDYPYLARTITEVLNKDGWVYADEFEFGLDLVLDGLDRLASVTQ